MKTLRSLWRASESGSGWSLPSKAHNNGICLLCRRSSSGSSPSASRIFANVHSASLKTASYARRSFAHATSSRKQGTSSNDVEFSKDRIKKEDTTTLSERFRGVMRQMPHPVVVITTLDCPHPPPQTVTASSSSPSSSNVSRQQPPPPPPHWTNSDVLDSQTPLAGEEKRRQRRPLRPIPRAMTVSSFTSLSLRPRQRVLFNIALPSRTYHAILGSGRFNVHVLTGDDDGARIAQLFTKGYGLGGVGDGDGNRSILGILAGLERHDVKVLGIEECLSEWDSDTTTADAAGDIPSDGESSRSESRRKFTAPLLQGPGIMHVLKCDLYSPRYLDYRPPPPSPTTSSGDSESTPPRTGAKKGEEGAAGDDQHDNFAIMLGDVTEIVHSGGDDNAPVEGGARGQQLALAYADGAYMV